MLRRIVNKFGQPLRSTVLALFAPAEDPRVVFGDQLQGLRALLREVEQTSSGVEVLREQLSDRMRVIGEKLPQLDDEARQALATGHDDLARAILQRRQLAALESRRLAAQEKGLVGEDQRLALLAQRLLAQIESLSTLQNVATAQYSAAETRARIAEALASVARNLENLGVDVTRAEKRTEWMRAFASAIDDLTAEGVSNRSGSPVGDQLDRRPDELELEPTIDERIDLLKSQLAQSKSTGEQ